MAVRGWQLNQGKVSLGFVGPEERRAGGICSRVYVPGARKSSSIATFGERT